MIKKKNVEFDKTAGGNDGYRSYEILNLQGDTWRDIGDWIEGATPELHMPHDILFPGGEVVAPEQSRGMSLNKQVIKVALLSPLDARLGSFAQMGEEFVIAAKVALDMINNNDNYAVQFVLTEYDSGFHLSELDTQLESIKNAGEQVVIGAVRSSRSIPTAEWAAPLNIPVISYGSTSSDLSDKTKYPSFHRVIPNDNYQGKALCDVLEEYGYDKVGLVYTTDSYAGNIARTFKEEWLSRGNTLSPSWENTPSFEIQTANVKNANGVTYASDAVSKLKSQSTANVFVVAAITADGDWVVEEAKNQGMTGEGWVWTGFDGLTGQTFEGDTKYLEEIFQGVVGTSVKLPDVSQPLFDEFVAKWIELYPNQLPWDGSDSIQVGLFDAQVYDAMAIAAQAVTNFLAANPDADVTSADITAELQKAGVTTPGMGNVNAAGMVEFLTEEGGYDGHPSYEVVNLQADVWRDVGDWDVSTKLTITHTVQWPGGKTVAPAQGRENVPNNVVDNTESSDETMPSWVAPLLIIAFILALGAICSVIYIYYSETSSKNAFFGHHEMGDDTEMASRHPGNKM